MSVLSHHSTGNKSAAAEFSEALRHRQAAFDTIFWNETGGIWKDWDLESRAHLTGFYDSSFVPLLWGCNPPNITKHEKGLRALNALGLLDYPGGIPTSLNKHTTQQWDFPNAWAPLQWFPVVGWYSSTSAKLRDAAYFIAQTWITTTLVAWEANNQSMFEKVCVYRGDREPHLGCLFDSGLYCFVFTSTTVQSRACQGVEGSTWCRYVGLFCSPYSLPHSSSTHYSHTLSPPPSQTHHPTSTPHTDRVWLDQCSGATLPSAVP